MVRIRSVRPLDGLRVELGLTDGSTRIVDVGPLLRGPMLEPLRRDADLFRAVRVDETLGTIVWPNDADLDPDVLVLSLPPL
ncbi:DUF2442 domain-containing protein [Anaeromyxobacter oryzisoli]|uniref:DUF2442 domain-containing protein n=1 Tax=Anaeromyxobacter oryzisoli TaxID=2925408 RepID=UPI001F5AE2E2|nr:DUF2442 domain-containing protein [Anaeromyxobacter sp. SG63]